MHNEHRSCDGHTWKFSHLKTVGQQLEKTHQKCEILLLPACLSHRVMDICRYSSHTTGSAKLIGGKRVPATLSVHATRLSHNNDEIQFAFAGHKLVCNTKEGTETLVQPTKHVDMSCVKANKDGLFGKSDPFYIISKRREGTTEWVPCFTSGPWWLSRHVGY